MERAYMMGLNATQRLENGASVRTKEVVEYKVTPKKTSMHEAIHGYLANPGEVIEITNVGDGDSLGKTVLTRPNPIAAAGPAALGYEGVGFDEFNIIRMGCNLNATKAAARSKLAGAELEVFEIASLVEARRRIGQAGVYEGIENARRIRQGIFPVEVEITSSEGKVTNIRRESLNGEVYIQDLLPKAA